MQNAVEITLDTKAWISQYSSLSPDELRTPEGAATLQYSRHDLSSNGFTYAGEAKVTVTLLGQRDLIDQTVASLRMQATNIRAQATAQCTQIESQIQQLLAIEYDAPEAKPAAPEAEPTEAVAA